jgi:hypothetical protein
LHLVRWHSPVEEPKYKDSTELKRINFFVSQNAWPLIAGTKKDFETGTILEHLLPLDKMYFKLQKQQEQLTLTSESNVDALCYWPLITVTSDEDNELKKLSRLTDPLERYAKAGIVVGRVETINFGTEPVWKPISLSDPTSWEGA